MLNTFRPTFISSSLFKQRNSYSFGCCTLDVRSSWFNLFCLFSPQNIFTSLPSSLLSWSQLILADSSFAQYSVCVCVYGCSVNVTFVFTSSVCHSSKCLYYDFVSFLIDLVFSPFCLIRINWIWCQSTLFSVRSCRRRLFILSSNRAPTAHSQPDRSIFFALSSRLYSIFFPVLLGRPFFERFCFFFYARARVCRCHTLLIFIIKAFRSYVPWLLWLLPSILPSSSPPSLHRFSTPFPIFTLIHVSLSLRTFKLLSSQVICFSVFCWYVWQRSPNMTIVFFFARRLRLTDLPFTRRPHHNKEMGIQSFVSLRFFCSTYLSSSIVVFFALLIPSVPLFGLSIGVLWPFFPASFRFSNSLPSMQMVFTFAWTFESDLVMLDRPGDWFRNFINHHRTAIHLLPLLCDHDSIFDSLVNWFFLIIQSVLE